MAFVCASPCTENQVQLAKIVYTVALDEVDLLQFNPFMNFVSQKIVMTSDVASDTHQEITMTLGFAKDDQQEFTPSFGFVKDTQHEKTRMSFNSCEQTWLVMEVSDYHLIFDLNGVLVAIGEGQTKSHLVVLRLGFKKFLSACVNKFTMYKWSLAMKRNFLKHLDIIVEKTNVFFPSFRILD
jgi:hypothetical protein